ncbi:MAG: NUDIX hydrolase [Peptostreptococcaceae bacterium]|nr:NUDIX hydrolase [Peptostreptococcaceae bacterium]
MSFKEETITSKMIYKGSILNLRKDTVKVKNGISFREVVEHNGGSVVVAITDNKKVLMVNQFRKPLDKEVLELPAGKIDGEEDPKETALRELKEETGYTAKTVRYLTKFYPSVGYTNEILYIYLCTDLIPGETDFDENEDIEIFEYDMELLVGMILAGKINDGKTIAGIMIANETLKKE